MKDARHLQKFLAEYPEQSTKGYIVCRIPHAFEVTDNILALPWEELSQILQIQGL